MIACANDKRCKSGADYPIEIWILSVLLVIIMETVSLWLKKQNDPDPRKGSVARSFFHRRYDMASIWDWLHITKNT